jgi:hypothetical protein
MAYTRRASGTEPSNEEAMRRIDSGFIEGGDSIRAVQGTAQPPRRPNGDGAGRSPNSVTKSHASS